jgi:hypothetical protein
MKRCSVLKSAGIIMVFVALLNANPEVSAQGNTGLKIPQFLFPSFEKSTVLLKSGVTITGDFNYNMVDEEMIFTENGIYKVPQKPEDIDTVYIQNRKFVRAENVFYEVIVKGKVDLFIQHKSKYSSVGTPTAYGMTSQTNAVTSTNIARTGNQVRSLDIPDNVQVTPVNVYWARTNGQMYKFTSQKQFLKIFPEHEADLKGYIKSNKLDIDIPADLQRLGRYCNEIIK